MTWQDEAACKGMGTDLFFTPHLREEARRVCSGCPVIAACQAASAGEYGTWGGRLTRLEGRLQNQHTDASPPPAHGVQRMFRDFGCRCAVCMIACPHGTESGAVNWRCRCDECLDARRANNRARRAS